MGKKVIPFKEFQAIEHRKNREEYIKTGSHLNAENFKIIGRL